MKKIIPTLMALVLVLSMFTACSQTDKTAGTDDNKSSATTDSDIPNEQEIQDLFTKAINIKNFYDYSETESAVYKEFGPYDRGDIIIENTNTIINKNDYDWENDDEGRGFYITNLKYQQALDKYSELFTGDLLNEFMTTYFYNYNGALCVYIGGGKSGSSIKNIVITYKDKDENEYNYSATFDYVTSDTDDNTYSNSGTSIFSVIKTENGYRITK